MVNLVVYLISSLLIFSSIETFAEEVIVTGNPVVLDSPSQVYSYPSQPVVVTSPNYVAVPGNTVCYAEQPTVIRLNNILMNSEVGDLGPSMKCYNIGSTYLQSSE